MAVQVSYPGVYIDEFAPGAPIQGVGTSTAAFIGPTRRGDLNDPAKLTSWDDFKRQFGDKPVSGFYLWYAVRGFFENGGQVCYIVRASNGRYGELLLPNRDAANPADVIRIRARQPGDPNPAIQVDVAASHAIAGASLYQPATTVAAVNGRDLQVANEAEAAQFKPGDRVDVNGETAVVSRVSVDILQLTANLTGAPAAGDPVRLADAPAGTQTFRIQTVAPPAASTLVGGTMLTITQGGADMTGVIDSVKTEPGVTDYTVDPPVPVTPTTYRVTFRDGLDGAISLDPANAAAVQSEEFDLQVTQGVAAPPYTFLSMDPAHPNYFLDAIANDALITAELVEPPPTAAPPFNLPADTGGAQPLANGADEDLATIAAADYIRALEALEDVDDVNLIAAPDCAVDRAMQEAVQQAIIAHCEQMADRFGVLDARPAVDLFGDGNGAGSLELQRNGLDSTRGYAALYHPWLRVLPQGTGAPILVPPSGHVCGIMARSDNTRGVHKAPANEIVNGALGVAARMSDITQGQLNLVGINVIRVFQDGGRPMVWGARTTATDTNWQYVNIRRLFLYLEESIQEGIRWAVFEPNNLQLWQKLKRTITDFLTRAWRDGALFGEKAEDAFYVRIDEVLNPFSEQQLGRLNIEIGLRPAFPAEFIIVRIGIWDGGSETSEG